MVKLRLKRTGRKFEAIYHIVATDSRSPRDGRFIEEIGFYNPEKKIIRVNDEMRAKWEKNGAVASDTVKSLFTQYDRHKKGANGEVTITKKAPAAPKPKKPKKAAE